jgi:dGTPase
MKLAQGQGAPRSEYAADPAKSRGRLFVEPASPTRTEYQRDRDRIVHSTAFRRLAHKTQVFVDEEGDHFRTRLTHTIEVAQVARSIARDLRLDEDLAEATALGHDLGHTPFGHTGEDALANCLVDHGGFDHNSHGFRIVTALERRYAEFDGLNLTAETLEALVKHNGPPLLKDGSARPGLRLSPALLAYDRTHSLRLSEFASLEGEVAAIADDIAYLSHDVDDGLRAELFTLDGLRTVPIVSDFLQEIETRYPDLERGRTIHELGRRLITRFIEDAVGEARRRAARLGEARLGGGRLGEGRLAEGRFGAAVRRDASIVAFSPGAEQQTRALRDFLFENMYRHANVRRVREQADAVVRRLFSAFVERPELMPREWRARIEIDGVHLAAGEYIAGMTDRFALNEHRRIFDASPQLR